MVAGNIDNLVLGTVNAPWKRTLGADLLATRIAQVDTSGWLPHLATFFTEVSPHLVFEFAKEHEIPGKALIDTYSQVTRLTGERNKDLEDALARMGKAA
jgi:hypothetical protein